jgi:hypothetical protein
MNKFLVPMQIKPVASEDHKGISISLIAGQDNVEGLKMGLINAGEKLRGLLIGLMNRFSEVYGLVIGFGNIVGGKGISIGFMNVTEKFEGISIGAINLKMGKGKELQVGLINFDMEKPYLPLPFFAIRVDKTKNGKTKA